MPLPLMRAYYEEYALKDFDDLVELIAG